MIDEYIIVLLSVIWKVFQKLILHVDSDTFLPISLHSFFYSDKAEQARGGFCWTFLGSDLFRNDPTNLAHLLVWKLPPVGWTTSVHSQSEASTDLLCWAPAQTLAGSVQSCHSFSEAACAQYLFTPPLFCRVSCALSWVMSSIQSFYHKSLTGGVLHCWFSHVQIGAHSESFRVTVTLLVACVISALHPRLIPYHSLSSSRSVCLDTNLSCRSTDNCLHSMVWFDSQHQLWDLILTGVCPLDVQWFQSGTGGLQSRCRSFSKTSDRSRMQESTTVS